MTIEGAGRGEAEPERGASPAETRVPAGDPGSRAGPERFPASPGADPSGEDSRDWLIWVSQVRFLVITVLFAVVLVLRNYTGATAPFVFFVPVVVVWYALALFFGLLIRRVAVPRERARRVPRWVGPIQIFCDLLMVTGVVFATGGHESYFITLYILVILVASILFTRAGAFLVAGV
ncbi:MAG TPA: hypothetical protein VEG63_11525, partial [Candidatus Acidoferrales bacterium]|nr:hypothetical protein [Candidatus Acidoferrales bacterium]